MMYPQLKLIFIHIPKNGGTNFAEILHKYDGGRIRAFHQIGKHQSICYYSDMMCPHINMKPPRFPEFWDISKYLKITIVRNPFDRLVSWWFYSKSKNLREGKLSLKDFINLRKGSTQLKYLRYKDGNIGIDRILRYEKYVDELTELFNELGLKDLDLNINSNSTNQNIGNTINNIKRNHYSHYYNDETIKLVETYFKEDLDIFGYKFEKEIN